MCNVLTHLCIVLELTGLSRGIVLSSDSETAPEDGAAAGATCCCPVREGDLDCLSTLGESLRGGVPPGENFDD